jgi:hypothetical protein
VRADVESLKDLGSYEAFTCLEEGTRPEQHQIVRSRPDRNARYSWTKNTSPVGPREQVALIATHQLKPEEALLQLQDPETGKPVYAHSGTVYWNQFRGRWIMITVELGGTSPLGEVWYAEADTPVGPWAYARKIVTHDRYSFYNPKQDPIFDKEGGRVIFFEGTYANTFSGNPNPTPRYDYNQIMYKLDLADPRLVLPLEIHHPIGAHQLSEGFFAADRPAAGLIPVYEQTDSRGHHSLKLGDTVKPEDVRPQQENPAPVFYALPFDAPNPPRTTLLLYEFVSADGADRDYLTEIRMSGIQGYRRQDKPLCRVWCKPVTASLPEDKVPPPARE